MSEYFVHPIEGNDANPGTELAPWKTIPGMAGANAVASGDIINVRNGTLVKNDRLILSGNNLTYRGYGLSDSPLRLKLPVFVTKVPQLHEQVVVREPGVHEGYWTIDGSGITSQGILIYSTKTGCVIEDCQLVNCLDTSVAISIGTLTQAQVGATLRRSQVIGARQGVSNYRPNTLIEYCLFKDIADDGVIVATSASQSLHAGNFNTIRHNNFINNGYDTAAAVGDAFQLNNSTGYQGTLSIYGNYIYKPSEVKQGFFLSSMSHRVYIYNNYFDGAVSGATQIGLTKLLAGLKIYISGNYWRQPRTNGNPLIHLAGGAMQNGSELYITKNFVDVDEHAGLFSWGSEDAAPAGAVYIRNNTVKGRAYNGLSWSANIGLQTAGTIGATASAVIENNLLIGPSPVAFKLPTGGLNDPRWVFRNNLVDGALAFAAVGVTGTETTYTKDTFEAGHSAATGNKEESATQAALEGEGYFYGYATDMNGKAFYNPPSIGCYEYERPRISRN